MPLFLRLLIKHKIDAYALKSFDGDIVPVRVRSAAPKNGSNSKNTLPFFSVIRGLRTNSRKIRKRRENRNLRMIPNLRRSVFTRRQTERLCKDTVKMSLVFVSRQTDNFFDVQRRSAKQFCRRPQPFFL